MFKKGDKVHFIRSWDNKGTYAITPLTVYSCGKKQMILVDDSGQKFAGTNFLPTEAQTTFRGKTLSVVVAGRTDAEAEAIAVELAAVFRQVELDRLSHCLTISDDKGYLDIIKRGIAAVEATPASFIWRK